MVDDVLLSNNDFVVPIEYLVLRLETLRISCMSIPLLDIKLIGLEVPDLVQPVIGGCRQPYEGY